MCIVQHPSLLPLSLYWRQLFLKDVTALCLPLSPEIREYYSAHDTAISRLFCFRYTTNLSPAKFCLQTYTDTYCIFVMTLFHICLKIKQLHVASISEGGGGGGGGEFFAEKKKKPLHYI